MSECNSKFLTNHKKNILCFVVIYLVLFVFIVLRQMRHDVGWSRCRGNIPQLSGAVDTMASSQKITSFSSKSWENRYLEEEEGDTETMFDVFDGKMREVCAGDFSR